MPFIKKLNLKVIMQLHSWKDAAEAGHSAQVHLENMCQHWLEGSALTEKGFIQLFHFQMSSSSTKKGGFDHSQWADRLISGEILGSIWTLSSQN